MRGNNRWRSATPNPAGQSVGNSSGEDRGGLGDPTVEINPPPAPRGHIFILDEVGDANDGWIDDWNATHSRGVAMDRWKARFSGHDREYHVTELFGTREEVQNELQARQDRHDYAKVV